MAVSLWILALSPPASGHLCSISVEACMRFSKIRIRSRRYSPAAVLDVFILGGVSADAGAAGLDMVS